jgi:hypothetical protein
MTIGINWKSVWKPVWKQVWEQTTPVPPTPPVFVDQGGSPAARRRARRDWLIREAEVTREIEQQNADDIEVVRVLTEFLSRM